MILYTSQYREKADNTLYRNATPINSIEDLKAAVCRDHIAAEMKDGYRSSDNFIKADCIQLDLDNTHSEDPADWKTIDDVAEAFPDVRFYYIQSRNYMKPKTKTTRDGKTTYYEAREKYHCYFPLAHSYSNFAEYERLMLTAAGLFPFFDLGAAKPAQFFFGVGSPAGGEEPGSTTLDSYVKQQPPEAVIASVNEFVDKVNSGEYKQSGETEKAVSRLLGFFGINPAASATTASELPERRNDTGAEEQYSNLGMKIAEAEQRQRVEWFENNFAKQHNIPVGKKYRIKSKEHPNAICICVPCPWEDEHSMNGAENEAVVIIDLGGRLSFLCRHSHGAMYGWREYRAYYETRDAQKAAEGAEAASGENIDDKAGQQDNTPENGTQAAETLQGLLTYSAAVNIFETADNETIELKSFPTFSKTARIKKHDSIVIAADTGGGKSSLAINFMHDLSENYPCIYINLEMDTIDVLQRLVAIQSGLEIDRIQGYQNDEQTAAAVNIALQSITSREPVQIIQGAYMLEDVQDIIEKSIKGREKPTAVFIDHSLLMDTRQGASGRYDRFTQLSEGLRKMALKYNIILFVLLQQNRAGKAVEEERPKNSSLKESGSWENDSTQICFLWYDPAERRKKLLLTKNRHGSIGEFPLNYWSKTQTYTEASDANRAAGTVASEVNRPAISRRDKQREKLEQAYTKAYTMTGGKPTLRAIAEAADVATATVKGWIREYGGCTVDGVQQDPAGLDTEVEYTGFVRLTAADEDPFYSADKEYEKKQKVTASF